ncbi:methyltransferase, FxLD system [Streptosporangium minutum]|uniref:Protein-L-isoaspartate O-methyltransferase n=1 Tax=Streptosporangium minutum TaxID=569862 RepID=A0A243RJ10_9ACTN|nr:methyltransferase, FxLD system [Streptosporangium minutum]OUC94870.1 methyltransferase, FxLD system [Streptosporangium minutum]
MTADTLSPESAERLRADMVATLIEQGSIRSPEVEAAFAKVPRDRFAPEAPLTDAYAPQDVVITRRDAGGRATSSLSAPWLQAEMLEAARLFPGAKVLEIGSGGYNAALIAEIVGPSGLVVSVDIDPFVAERAGRFLAEIGYSRVRVVLGDAEDAAAEHVPEGGFDAIIVTVGVWDIPWGPLLAPAGRMVVPLRFSTVSRSFTFVRDGDHFVGLDPMVCGFVAMQGAGALPDQEAVLADGAVRLTLEEGPALDVAALDQALTGDRAELWTGVTVGRGEPFDSMHLWIATADDRFGMIWQDPERDCGMVKLAMGWYCPVLITADSFAYLAIRELPRAQEATEHRWEFGVCGYGPAGAELARHLHDHVQVWDRGRRTHTAPRFILYPAEALPPVPAVGRIFRKRHTQLVMTWP